ncbi:MAG: hypothetical protein KDA41_05370 [Planctomycetales bacterium]|nr:hypothetical protein [Planctomycetales bacterium]
MIRTFGRLLQIFGLVLLPGAMVMQLMEAFSAGMLLVMLLFGVAAFYLGRMIEGYAPRS